MREYIVGAGGGGGKGGGGGSSSPVEEPDSLHSRDSVVVLDALCEGEIFGLVDGLKSVYLNDTPVQNANGSYNFTNLQIGTSNGTQLGVSGSAIMLSIAADVRSEVAVVTRVMQATPVVRRIADLNVNAVDVRVSTPRMVQGDNQGNQSATSINFIIEVNTNGGGYVARVTDTFSGKTTSKYDRTYRLALTGVGPWDIRLTRLSADSTTSLLQNELWFDALTAIISQRLSYPNTALVAMAADARAFQSIPKRSYDIKGLIVRVPSNYNATTRVYTGLWDGTFKLAWTDNPAWCFYDLLTNARYGLGAYLPATAVDKWGLYTIAQYCDALVPNGFGGTEPRFTFNAYITTRAEAFTVVNQLASAFRGMVYWANGTINAVQDAPLDPTALFTRANVIDGAFNYTGASRKAMHTVALVQWNDPANAYQPAIEYVEDAAAIAVYGVIEAQLAAVGCTSRGQAHRLGQWLLYSEKLEQEVITFKSAMDSAYVRPGQIIKVQDAHRAGKRVGGRLASTGNTVSSLTLDAPVTIESGKTYTVAVVLPDGSIGSAPVNNGVGATTSLTLSGIGLAAVPQPNAIWVLTVSDLSPTLWRVLAVAEAAKNEYAITALAHNPSKFSGIENGTALQLPNAVSIPAMPGAVQNITFKEDLILAGGAVRSRVNIGWDAVQYGAYYQISWRPVPGNWNLLPLSMTADAVLIDAPIGMMEVQVQAKNSLGIAGPVVTATAMLFGKTAPPEDVTQFFISRDASKIFFRWNPVIDLDVAGYEIRLGDTWEVAVVIGSSATHNWSTTLSQGGQFLIKALDTTGNYSRNAAAAILPANIAINVVALDDDATYGWPGLKTSLTRLGSALTLGYLYSLNALPGTLDSYPQNLMATGGVLSAGNYLTDIHDMGVILSATISIAPHLAPVQLGLTLAAMPQTLIMYSRGWTLNGSDGGIASYYEINTSLDNLVWSGWRPFMPGLFTFRFYQLRANFTVQPGFQISFAAFPVSLDMPDRVERHTGLAIPSAGLVLAFDSSFTAIYTLHLTLQNGAAGDSYTLTNRSNSGVTINGFDSAGVAKVITADLDIYGY